MAIINCSLENNKNIIIDKYIDFNNLKFKTFKSLSYLNFFIVSQDISVKEIEFTKFELCLEITKS